MPAPRNYEISISGSLDELKSAFAPHPVRVADGLSHIRIQDADQATLFSVIGLVQELGLDLREVRII